MLLPHSPTPPDPPPCRQRRHYPPCVGFGDAAVGLLQLGVRGPKSLSAPGLVRDINSHVVICLPLMVVRLSGVRMLGILGFMLYHLSHLHVL